MDFTEILVALISLVATVLFSVLVYFGKKYVLPWVEQHDLSQAAEIVVNAVEAILGRYVGEDKWTLALKKMQGMGWNVDSERVIDALKAAWEKLNLKQIEAGVKAPETPETEGEKDVQTQV